MTDFIFSTNNLNSTTYDGPSGFRYVIYGRKPFSVTNPKDIEFFKNNDTFEEMGFIKKIINPPEKFKGKDEILKEELDKIELSDFTKEKITRAFASKEELIENLEEGYQIDPNIPKEEIERINSYFLQKVNLETKKTKKSKKR